MNSNIKFFINNEPIWLTAISNNNFSLWSFWLKQNPDIHIKDSTGQTPLHWACFLKRKEMVFDLLQLGADPWETDKDGYSAYFLAMIHPKCDYWNFHEWPRIFTDNFEIKNNTTLYYHFGNYIFKLSKSKRYECVKSLCQIMPSYKMNEFILLKNNNVYNIPWIQMAYAWRDQTLAKIYIDWGVDINAVDQHGYSVLEMAIVDENMEWVDFLLENGAVFNENKNCDDYTLSCLVSGENAYNIYSILEKKNLNTKKIVDSLHHIDNNESKMVFLRKCFNL